VDVRHERLLQLQLLGRGCICGMRVSLGLRTRPCGPMQGHSARHNARGPVWGGIAAHSLTTKPKFCCIAAGSFANAFAVSLQRFLSASFLSLSASSMSSTSALILPGKRPVKRVRASTHCRRGSGETMPVAEGKRKAQHKERPVAVL